MKSINRKIEKNLIIVKVQKINLGNNLNNNKIIMKNKV